MIGAVPAIVLLLGVAARPSVSAFATRLPIIGTSSRQQTRAAVRGGGAPSYYSEKDRPLFHPSRIAPCLRAATEPNKENNNGACTTSTTTTTAELEALERQVRASARETVDWNRVLKALEQQTDNNAIQLARNDLMYDDEPLLAAENNNNTPSWTSHLQVAAAAGLVTGAGSYLVLQNYYISLFVAGFVFVTAFLVDDDDNLTGALARILGRRTLQSVQATQPRVRALARAVVTGEAEIVGLKERVRQLEQEAAALRRWKEQRIRIDRALPRFKVEELRAIARDNELVTKGTKLDLLVRLVEADILELD